MKKLLASLSLSLAALTASAAGPVVGLQYDVDRANGTGFNMAHETKLSIAQDIKIGTIDGGLIMSRFNGAATSDNANGFEVGYGNGMALGKVGLKGRVAYGRMNRIDPNGGGFTGNSSYYSLGVEGAVPLNTQLNGFVGYRHRNSFHDEMIIQNRYTAGIDYAVNKNVALRVGYAHTRQGTLKYNGLTTGLTYAF